MIIQDLKNSHNTLATYIANLSKEEYYYSFENKWNAAKHLDHIIKSVTTLHNAFKLPKWFVKWKFGKANRPSRTKEELIAKYLDKLQTAKPTPKQFQPKEIDFNKREKKLVLLKKTVEKMCVQVNKMSELELDYYIFPHPLLGRLTFRELLYFTAYHASQHKELIEKSLKNKING